VVYDAEPAPRRAHDVIIVPAVTAQGPSGQRGRRVGPNAQAKWLTGSVTQPSEQVIRAVFDQATQRDPTHRRTWVVLVDGARHQLDLIRDEAQRRGVRVHILVDLIHVMEYLWKACWCLHAEGDPHAEAWVATHAISILSGHLAQTIAAIDAQAVHAGLSGKGRRGVDTCIGYLTAKQGFLDYQTALERGWPIATGVIEGACRHLIGDRLDISGARWGLAGAEAVLKLRALKTNGDFDRYWRFHLARENHRVHKTLTRTPTTSQPDHRSPYRRATPDRACRAGRAVPGPAASRPGDAAAGGRGVAGGPQRDRPWRGLAVHHRGCPHQAQTPVPGPAQLTAYRSVIVSGAVATGAAMRPSLSPQMSRLAPVAAVAGIASRIWKVTRSPGAMAPTGRQLS
jgi:hypothetical protein